MYWIQSTTCRPVRSLDAWKAAAAGDASELTRPLDEAAHFAITGFRELYGLEILREALPELTTLLRVGRSKAN